MGSSSPAPAMRSLARRLGHRYGSFCYDLGDLHWVRDSTAGRYSFNVFKREPIGIQSFSGFDSAASNPKRS